MTSRRREKFNSLLRNLIASFAIKEISGVIATISRVENSDDLKTAKIFISIFPESKEAEALKCLKGKVGELRQFIGSQIKTKFLPHLEFVIDAKPKAERRIEKILNDQKEILKRGSGTVAKW